MTETTQAPTWTLGDRIRKAMDVADIKRNDLARELGVDPGTVSRWINDSSYSERAAIKRSHLRVIALLTGQSLEWLEHGEAADPYPPAGTGRPGDPDTQTVLHEDLVAA